jgi:hypothetical protein
MVNGAAGVLDRAHSGKCKEKWLMKLLFPLVSAFALIGCSAAFAQDEVEVGNAKPKFMVLPATVEGTPKAGAGTPLPTWNGSFVYAGHTYRYNMVGTAPSQNSTTTIQAVIIPIKFIITKGTKKLNFDPAHVLPNGKSVTNNTKASPLFDATTHYIQGGTDLGTTQYIDAYQRGNFWGIVGTTAPNYHLLLGAPTVLAEQTLSPPTTKGTSGNPFGNQVVAEVDINWFDTQAHALLLSLNIQPNTLPIFLTYNTYLTSGGCCIGGYHSAVTNTNGTVAYLEATYVSKAGDFSQDVSALSHEIGEWADDPLVVNTSGNPVSCGILEVGDPEEGFTNYGGYPYAVGGFSYTLQDLVYLPYFGAPTSTSANGALSFQDNPFSLSVCSNGG